MSILEFRSVSYVLRSGKSLVCDLNLFFQVGQFSALVGPNGSGKSTSFDLAVGLRNPTSGQVFWNGHSLSGIPFWKRVRLGLGYLPQKTTLLEDLTVLENLEIPLRLHQYSPKKRSEKLSPILDEFELNHLLSRRAAVLSGGEKRRVELARLLLLDPAMLFLDEPFAGVDPQAIDQLVGILKKLVAKGYGIILTDHNVLDVFSACQHIWVLFEGRLLAHGSPQELAENEMVRRTYLGERVVQMMLKSSRLTPDAKS